MEPTGSGQSQVPVYAVIALILAATGVFIIDQPLKSFRPLQPTEKPPLVTAEIEARLWEDPIAAVRKRINEITRQTVAGGIQLRDFYSLCEEPGAVSQAIRTCLDGQSKKLLILPVMLSAGYTADDHETRLRTRYAVLAALESAGYTPSHPDSLRFAWIPSWPENTTISKPVEAQEGVLPSTPSNARMQGRGLIIPYEWCAQSRLYTGSQLFLEDERKGREGDRSANSPNRKGEKFQYAVQGETPPGEKRAWAYDEVLVLWVETKALAGKPMAGLRTIIKEHFLRNLGPENTKRVLVQIIGPPTSDGLRDMLNELRYGETASRPRQTWKVYSPRATAALSLFHYGGNATESKHIISEWGEKEQGIIVRTIASDEHLLEALIDEIKSRSENQELGHVAIISEWDTFYGRALPLTFAACATLDDPKEDSIFSAKQSKSSDDKSVKSDILRDRLDALRRDPSIWPPNISRVIYLRGLDGRLAREGSDVEPKEREDRKGVRELERPEGPSQLDYARRLAENLKRKEKDGGRFNAIGILGSDVYDKLLLLQALCPLFRHTIFFTTDLDARLLHRSQNQWARNLIIASSYGLEPPKIPGRELPPFRDGYQTSTYVAILKALGCVDIENSKGITEPKLYEVGRTRARQLEKQRSENLETVFLRWWKPVLLALIILMLVACLLIGWKALLERKNLINWSLHAGFFVVVALGCLYVRHIESLPEAFAWFEGISIWPSEILRLLAAFLALHFLIKAHYKLAENNRYLSRKYHLAATRDTSKVNGDNRLKKLCVFLCYDWSRQDGETDIALLWKEYMQRGSYLYRWIRVGLFTALYLLFGFSIMAILGTPIVPFRGEASLTADFLVLAFSVCLLVLLIAFVVDATLLCDQFIKRISKEPSRWPPKTVDAYSKEKDGLRKCYEEWLGIDFIADRTEFVGSLVVAPFLVLFFMILSRMNLFDRWDWPASLIIILSFNSFFAIFCVLFLNRSARRIRAEVTQSLKELRLKKGGDENTKKQLDLIIKEIEEIKRGAFAPVMQQPVLRAFLVPLGGIGTAVLLDFFGKIS